MFVYDNVTRQFSNIADSDLKEFVIVYRNDKSGEVKQKRLKADSKIKVMEKFRTSIRFSPLGGGFYKPQKPKAFELPGEQDEAIGYRDELQSESQSSLRLMNHM